MFGGVPTVYGIDPSQTETSPSHGLGTLGLTPDGRKFRYARAGEALVAGTLTQAAAEDTVDQGITPTAAAIGDRTITTSSTVTVTNGQYNDGYMVITITPGLGHIYKIKSHGAATAAALTFSLYDPIRVALTTTTRFDFVANPYAAVIINPTTATGMVTGVAFVAAANQAYTWIQTGGVASILSDGATAVGTQVVASNGTAGAVEDVASTTQAVIGIALSGITTAENGPVFLILD